MSIESPDDPRLADYRELTDVALRRLLEPERGLYIAESAKVIGRALGVLTSTVVDSVDGGSSSDAEVVPV